MYPTSFVRSYVNYDGASRTHLSLNNDTLVPQPANTNNSGQIVATPKICGLHHRYERLAASPAFPRSGFEG